MWEGEEVSNDAWTKEQPTEDGYYWLRWPESENQEACVVQLSSGLVHYCGCDESEEVGELWLGAEWQGPMKPTGPAEVSRPQNICDDAMLGAMPPHVANLLSGKVLRVGKKREDEK